MADNDRGASAEYLLWKILAELEGAGGSVSGTDVNVIQVGGAAVSLGQKAMAASIPVVISSNQSAVPISGSFAITDPLPAGTNNIGDVDVLSIAAGDNNIGNVDIVTLPALPAGTNNIGDVDVLSIAAGNNNIGDVDVASIAAGDNNIGNVDIVTLPALPAGTNAVGKLLPPDVDVTAHTNYARKYYTNAGAATDGIIWSPAAGKRWHVTTLIINVSAACTVTLEDDKGAGDDPVFKAEFAANSGIVMEFDPMYPFASGEDAADLLITTTAGNVYVTAVGYEV